MTKSFPGPFKNFSLESYPHDMEHQIEGLEFPKESIEGLQDYFCRPKTKEQIIYALMISGGNVKNAWLFSISRKYILKEALPEKGVITICGIQNIDGRPNPTQHGFLSLSDRAAEHYKVEKIEDLIGKKVQAFRRVRLPDGRYEWPNKMYLQKGILIELLCETKLMGAGAIIQCEDGTVSDTIRIDRICIDWD